IENRSHRLAHDRIVIGNQDCSNGWLDGCRVHEWCLSGSPLDSGVPSSSIRRRSTRLSIVARSGVGPSPSRASILAAQEEASWNPNIPSEPESRWAADRALSQDG